ncbi:hypothetical protein KKD70_05290, partial [Patescibacteria group bacterium]|nr:hypothetical protein [Patescibacteria group bacterium]
YPTSNPDFVPDPNAEQITFKSGGGVEIIPTGSTTPIQLTKEEYKTSQGGAGNVTNKVKEVQQAQQQAGQPQPGQEQTIQQRFNAGQTPDTFNLLGQQTSNDVRGTPIGNTLNTVAQILDSVAASLPIDFIKLKDPKSVSDIKEGYNSMAAVLNDDVQLYKAGLISYAQVQADLDQALSFTIRLQAETKGKGQANLAYWRDEGASIEAEVLKQLRNLENIQKSLGVV